MIQAGRLSISAHVYDIGTGGTTVNNSNPLINSGQDFTFETDGQDLKGEKVPPIINETLWEPGKTSAKLLTVQNTGSLAAKVKVEFDVNDSGLQNALWFDFVQIDEGGNWIGQFTQRSMSEISALGDATELKLKSGESVRFVLVYGMYESASNEYQGKTFSADVNILATQDTYEQDGFESDQYDKDAVYDQVVVETTINAEQNGENLVEAIAEVKDGGTIFVPEGNYKVPVISGLNDKEITIQGQPGAQLEASDEGFLTIRGSENAKVTIKDMIFEGEGTSLRGICFSGQQNINATLVVENCKFTGFTTGVFLGGVANATITNCTFENCTAGIGGSEDITGELRIDNCTFGGGVSETIGWAGKGTLTITKCPTCKSFNQYNGANPTTIYVENGEYSLN